MELLDIYDENGKYLGTEERKRVHENALWHKTVHCWLYDKFGNIYFQVRKDENKFYTTASGHVSARETLKEAFGREINEEIGININYNEAKLIEVVNFRIDRKNKDGTMFKDRAFANVFGYLLDHVPNFKMDTNEVIGIVKVNASDALNLFNTGSGKIDAEIIDQNNNVYKRKVDFSEFLVNLGETTFEKYGNILKFVINETK